MADKKTRVNIDGVLKSIINPNTTAADSTTQPIANNNPAPTSLTVETKPQENHPSKTYISRTYYVTDELTRAISLRIANADSDTDKDKSSIIRAALSAYLEQELIEIRRKKK